MQELEKLRHTAAHILAHAIKELYPSALPTIGPAIEDGFYYDFYNLNIKEEDLPKIEAKMKEIVKKDYKLARKEKKKKEAKDFFKKNKFKLEIIDELKEGEITFYEQGNFIDLCRGGHLESTGKVKAFKLMKLAGAYWRGDSKNEMLTRIYGTAFASQKELDDYLKMLEEAEKRNHVVIGKKLNLFDFHEYSPGAPFFHPKGAVIYIELLNFIREQYKKRGYKEVITPLLYDKKLWETSGHWEHFKDNMFILKIDGREFALKPMNCPSHCIMYGDLVRSYKDLPLRLADFAPLHRNEVRGALGGLTRVRKMSQDDSHIFAAEDQIEKEIENLIDFVDMVYKKTFDMDFMIKLSTRPKQRMGDDKLWDKAERVLEDVLKKKKLKYEINPGDGSFYGPKIDIHVKDCLKRTHQVATIQLDFQLPLRFNLEYDGKDGKKHTPIIIHRAILGSLERFIGLLTEHYAGRFPLWLSPVQVKIVTVNDRNILFANKVRQELEENSIRVEIDDRGESVPKKVRDAEVEKIPVIVTIGDKEVEKKTLALRDRNGKVKFGVKIEDLIKGLKDKIEKRELE
ncbi:MAG TPA: threonine--tRNA ligase [Candidatus Nanoarchaeia archaeon]|nr:threonine--tRNA ligase [Candidatus Nanoarchaeia archaeon]